MELAVIALALKSRSISFPRSRRLRHTAYSLGLVEKRLKVYSPLLCGIYMYGPKHGMLEIARSLKGQNMDSNLPKEMYRRSCCNEMSSMKV
jgi:hypothetical protein